MAQMVHLMTVVLVVLVVELEEIIHQQVPVLFTHLKHQIPFSLDTETQEEHLQVLVGHPVAQAVVAHQKQERITCHLGLARADMEFYYLLSPLQ